MTDDAVIALTNIQHEVFTHPARYRVWIAGRRSGKSIVGVTDCIDTAAAQRGTLSWYIAPTLEDARDLGWEPLKALVPPELVAATNETRMAMTLVNGSRIVMKSADRPDRLRGRGLHKVILDEFRWIDPAVWPVIRPALSTTNGRALFITSPGGFNWAYEFFLRGQGGDPKWHRWMSWQTTSAQGGLIPAEEMEQARAEMDPRMFRQEYEASFETLEGRVYSNFHRALHVKSVLDAGGELLVGMDFNVHPMSYVVAVRAGDECHVLAAYELPISNTEEAADHLAATYPGRRIVVCPDPSGRARKTSAPVGQTDFTILQRRGFVVQAPNAAPPVVDRVNNVQAMLRNAQGRSRVTVAPSATALIKALDGLTYKAGTNLPDKGSGLDHVTDAFGYLLWSQFNTLTPKGAYRPAPFGA